MILIESLSLHDVIFNSLKFYIEYQALQLILIQHHL